MAKFHINEEGEVGACSARSGNCPFGADDTHFDTASDARKAYELSQNAIAEAISKRKAAAISPSRYREIFGQWSIYRWPTSAIDIPELSKEDRTVTIDEGSAQNSFKRMAASVKNSVLQLSKGNLGSEEQNFMNTINKVVEATDSRSRERAYAALVLLQHVQRDFRKFDLPELSPEKQAVIDHWKKNKIRDSYPGTKNDKMNVHSEQALQSAKAIFAKDPHTWTDEDKVELDRVTKEQIQDWRGLVQTAVRAGERPIGPWQGFANEAPPKTIVSRLQQAVDESILLKDQLAKEAELLEKAIN